MYKILILGPQGSGKGTQASLLAQRLGVPALSMGQLLRDEVKSGSELGKEIDAIIHGQGKLVPDQTAAEVLKRRLAQPDAAQGYVLDGYPRNIAQYTVSLAIVQPTHVLLVDVPRAESLARLSKRAELEGRVDDTAELINTRLEVYENETKPILEEYRQSGVLHEVNGIGSVEEVKGRIWKIVIGNW